MENAQLKSALGFPQMSDEDLATMIGARASVVQSTSCGTGCGSTCY